MMVSVCIMCRFGGKEFPYTRTFSLSIACIYLHVWSFAYLHHVCVLEARLLLVAHDM